MVSADRNRYTLGDLFVDCIDRPERISDDFVISEGFVRAGLEGLFIAGRCGVENMNTRKNRICVLTRPSSTSVRQDV